MVASVDGVSSVGGKASGIGGGVDRLAMRAIRSRVDAVMIGAGTLRAERLKLGLEDPGARQPLAIVLCGSGDVPLDEHLIQGEQDVLLATPDDRPLMSEETPSPTSILRVPISSPGRVDLQYLLKLLRSERGVRRLLVEGGPGLNRALVDQSLANELFLTVAPRLLLGSGPAIIQGHVPHEPQELTLISAYPVGDEVFLRYAIN